MEFVIYLDESDSKGEHFSDFYGAAMISAAHLDEAVKSLNALKNQHHLNTEIKWSRMTENYFEKYSIVIGSFFDLIEAHKIKIRIMFRQTRQQSKFHRHDERYFKLYYQFVKHAFGWEFAEFAQATNLKLFFDQFPSKVEEIAKFKGYLLGLNSSVAFRKNKIGVQRENIVEIRSHDHVILQCLDVVLGAMSFRLNDKHLEIPAGKRRRGRRTKAKEKLYRLILSRIRRMKPNFNIGVSTGGSLRDRFLHRYSHWKFEPTDMIIDTSIPSKNSRRK